MERKSNITILKEKFYKYERLRQHKKNMLLVSKVVIGKTLENAKNNLRAIITKQKGVEGKFPQKCSKVIFSILSNIETSLANQKEIKDEGKLLFYVKSMHVNKGPTMGVVGIPRARGVTSPKYLATTNLYFVCLIVKDEKISNKT